MGRKHYHSHREIEFTSGHIKDKWLITKEQKGLSFYVLSVVVVLWGIFMKFLFDSFKPLFWSSLIAVGFFLLGKYFMDSTKHFRHGR